LDVVDSLSLSVQDLVQLSSLNVGRVLGDDPIGTIPTSFQICSSKTLFNPFLQSKLKINQLSPSSFDLKCFVIQPGYWIEPGSFFSLLREVRGSSYNWDRLSECLGPTESSKFAPGTWVVGFKGDGAPISSVGGFVELSVIILNEGATCTLAIVLTLLCC
jgi:hypothetical protein